VASSIADWHLAPSSAAGHNPAREDEEKIAMKRYCAIVALAAIATVAPVRASPPDNSMANRSCRGSGGSTPFAGWVAAECVSPSGYAMTVRCEFAAALSPNNRLLVVFGGQAEASGPQGAQLTYLRCAVHNEDEQSDSCEFANGGPLTQCFKAVPSNWRVSPIRICVEGFAVYGPTPVTIVTVPLVCSSRLLAPATVR
jgi:hypothetical protein